MQTLAQTTATVNHFGPDYVCPDCGRPSSVCSCGGRHHIHTQHGADRAILGLSRDGCRNADQLAGYDRMKHQIAAFHVATVDGDAQSLCEWGAELQARLEAAERRRAYAIQIAGTHETVVAAGAVFNVAIYNQVEVYA